MKRNKRFDFLGIKGVWNDIVNYVDWIRTIKREKANPQSIFNKFSLGNDWFWNIFVVLTLPGEDLHLPDQIKRLRVTESLRPVNKYFGEDLSFSEYLIPDFNQVFHDGEPTLSYMIIYRFSFKRLTWWWLLSRAVFLTAIIIGLFNVPWINLIEWISSLI